MASFDKRVGKSGKVSWRVRIRRTDGPAFVKAFAKKSDAEQWARTIEHKMDSGEVVPSSAARKHTLSDAIDRYLEVIPSASRAQQERARPEAVADLVEGAAGDDRARPYYEYRIAA